MNLQDPTIRRAVVAGAVILLTFLFGKDVALQLIGVLSAYVPAQ